jgi:hypothetical protein
LPTSQVSLSGVFKTVNDAKTAGLIILDWGVANAMLEEVFNKLAKHWALIHCSTLTQGINCFDFHLQLHPRPFIPLLPCPSKCARKSRQEPHLFANHW